MTRRKRLAKPTAKMVDSAIRVAAELLDTGPAHVRARAASILLRGEKDDADDMKSATDETVGAIVVLPVNGREARGCQTGFQVNAEGEPLTVQFFATPADRGQIERGLGGPLLLPASAA